MYTSSIKNNSFKVVYKSCKNEFNHLKLSAGFLGHQPLFSICWILLLLSNYGALILILLSGLGRNPWQRCPSRCARGGFEASAAFGHCFWSACAPRLRASQHYGCSSCRLLLLQARDSCLESFHHSIQCFDNGFIHFLFRVLWCSSSSSSQARQQFSWIHDLRSSCRSDRDRWSHAPPKLS